MNIRHWIIFVMLSAFATGNLTWAQTFAPVKQIAVSDSSDRDAVNEELDAGPLDDEGDIVVRERLNLTQDNLQIRTFLEFDVSSLTAEDVAAADFAASFRVDFVTRLNTVNDMDVLVGRVLDDGVNGDSWSLTAGELPLFEWARLGDEVGESFPADAAVLIGNAKTDELGTYSADVTPIVQDWVNGVYENNGLVLFGGGDVFQGAGLSGAQIVVPEPSGLSLIGFCCIGIAVLRKRRN